MYTFQMTEDYFNGLNIVPLEAYAADHWILSASACSGAPSHPWTELFVPRDDPPEHSAKPPSTESPPHSYYTESDLCAPALSQTDRVAKSCARADEDDELRGEPEVHETIRLCDVEAFRLITAQRALGVDESTDGLAEITAGISRLSTSSSTIRPVIYRYVDVIKNSFALVEAIHFELFMPDRPDLRFLAVPFDSVPSGTAEGDYFRVTKADLLPSPSFAVRLKKREEYPVIWAACELERMNFGGKLGECSGWAYIVKKKANTHGGEAAIGELSRKDFFIRAPLFADESERAVDSLVCATMRRLPTAQLYPVEPPLGPPTPPSSDSESDEEEVVKNKDGFTEEEQITALEGLSPKELAAVYKALTTVSPDAGFNVLEYLKRYYVGEADLVEMLDGLGAFKTKEDEVEADSDNGRDNQKKFDPRSEYLKRIAGVRTSSQRDGRVVSAVRALDASEAEWIEDRLGAFTGYGQTGNLLLMDKLFRLGCQFRAAASRGTDARDVGEMRIDESIVLKTISDGSIGLLSECRPLFNFIYGRGGVDAAASDASDSDDASDADSDASGPVRSGQLQLNAAQSRAVRLYANPLGPRVFCILSPPGSGKTTVAAAMAAAVAREHEEGVQLLLSVQNVAVDNIGAALKKLIGGRGVYNMKSNKKLSPHNPTPFDFFDRMSVYELETWKEGRQPMKRTICRNPLAKSKNRRYETVIFKNLEECINFNRRQHEKDVDPCILLATVEMALQKMYTASKLCVDLENVTRVIVDEASLLTEAALYGLIRRFPKARIVLIGDEHQLPPFMYDAKILGHELAGRPALSVAMKTGRVPVVELNEVYRAPPSLVAPYNRLAYGGRLVSKKAEGESLLSVLGLVHAGQPQLLLIDVDGKEERNEKSMSLYNEKELEALIRLLSKFPVGWTKELMIICLYKDQKKRLQDLIDNLLLPEEQFTVLTVDSAQGKEAPIVILLTTRTQKATDFFCSTERCNVAVSRQQKALIILGKAPLLTTNAPWSTVVNGDDFTRIKAEQL